MRTSILVFGLLAGVSTGCLADGSETAQSAYEDAKTLFEAGDLQGAIPYLEEAHRTNPENKSIIEYIVRAYKLAGIQLYSAGQNSEALRIWAKAIAIDPDNEEILSYIRRTEKEVHSIEKLQNPDAEIERSAQPQVINPSTPVNQSLEMDQSPPPQAITPPALVSSTTDLEIPSAPVHHGLDQDISRLSLASGLAFGPSLSPGSGNTKAGTGWHFTGNLTVCQVGSPLSLRLTALYNDLTARQTGTAVTERKSQYSVAGVGIEGAARLWDSPSAGILVGGGVGAYHVNRSGYEVQFADDALVRTTSAAMQLSAGWKRELGLIGFTTTIRYLDFFSPRCPSIWQLSIGFESP